MIDKTNIPRHVAIMMDGNRRWAKGKGLSIIAGHAYAVDKIVEQLIERAGELGVEYLTLWAFSTENWGRAEEEVVGLMNLFRKALMTKVERFIAKGAKLKMIGDMSRFAPDIQAGMKEAMKKSEKNDKITVTFALNYGGRDEIKRAVDKWCEENRNQELGIRKDTFEKYLDTAGMPDPDLIIRTGGEMRLSGFLMWSAAYSELYFTEKLFPEFTPNELEKAIEEYQTRQRRFGK
ncbi:MAG: undecaprenyl diphosphate synthase, undecaprenyl diphosphate synthase [Microgenomates group bacterium GW2011_GWC1_46_16]|uniref:Isoprenyl transferase n=2 Tax=Candidatus Collieribacteriota TaxID=1752725 RepID=A0A1F5FXS5_9BACT|nr:MAG: Isoprenyl transferase [Microgenomates group bacterium GW2011_GWF1_46_12]KKU27057.1 MAG: undecaprenyl diphosphate synthase, undecaprenyl diphosphate synthase [Microgenomates group bacterium GW2011_GWC1_46_16]KKU27901.1 MAG: Isoprenyl transferase [Microgenomates group bacterium GW2011_GWF2_46_18]KKU44303.1 MAG: Isoprenyl transferase [Microgenomates group bacterium GW2011_GWA1_46_7]KKU44960.1 MAG: Isoprenyl transferase [Microgenomates group bacterium GW2011_GWB1_46_7]KKU60922.1 MAG: Isopr